METDAKIRPSGWLVISKKTLIIAGAVFVVICIVLSWRFFWRPNQPHSLLPTTIAKQITNFTPYFFFDKIPDGYSLDEKNISFDQGIIIIPLTKSGSPTIVLTEQVLPSNLSQDLLEQEDSKKIKDAALPAIINKVEGRMVGVMTSKQDRLLLLLNAPDAVRTEDMTGLLQALKPVK